MTASAVMIKRTGRNVSFTAALNLVVKPPWMRSRASAALISGIAEDNISDDMSVYRVDMAGPHCRVTDFFWATDL